MAPPDRFTALPAELRNAVYDLVLPETGIFLYEAKNGIVRPRKSLSHEDGLPPAILAVSRQIRKETLQLFSQKTKQRIKATLEDLPTVAEWYSRVADTCGFSQLGTNGIHLQVEAWCVGRRWLKKHFFPWVKFVRATGLARDAMTLWSYVGVNSTLEMDGMLDEAHALGLKVWTDGWDEGRLDAEFREWAEGV